MSERIKDFIEAGDVEIEKLILSREHLDSLPWEQFAVYNAALAAYNDIVAATDELTHLRADNAMLVEALEQIASDRDAGRHDGLPEPCPSMDEYQSWMLAKEALAKVKP